MTFNREEAAQRAEASRTNIPGFCQGWTHEIFGTPSAGDFDGDGSADAEDGWKMEPDSAKRPGDRHPPRGVPVSYLGGSHDNGHRAVSLGHGMIRSTDAGGPGIVATVPLSWPEVHWGLTYAGWSTTCDGVEIPLPPHFPKRLSARFVFHVHGRAYYYEEDSLRGMRLALAKAFGIDFDIQKTKDGVLVVCHGPGLLKKRRTGNFYDPLGKIPDNAMVSDLTWAEVKRLRSRDHKGYHIWRADVLVPRAVARGIRVVELDAKTADITKADWSALRAKIGDRSKMRVKAYPKFLSSLKHAHDAGFKTIALTHSGENTLPKTSAAWIDYFRGRKPRWF